MKKALFGSIYRRALSYGTPRPKEVKDKGHQAG